MTTAAPQTYELAPRPGQTASQRREELNAARFVAVRNLAHLIYKKPDGSSLMTYQETLDDREKVKLAIIQHEINLGLLTNDLGSAPAPVAAPVAPTAVAAVAAPTPMQVPMTQPQMVPVAPVAPMAPQMVPVAPAPVAPVAAPQAVAQVAPAPAGAPVEQAAPAPVTGRARRGRTPAGAGVAVAPPPAAAPMVPLAAAPAPQMAPPAPVAPQTAPPAPTFAPAFAAPAAPAQAVQQTFAAPVGTVQNVDLGPVIERLDKIGEGLSVVVKENEELKKANALMLVALHHLYSTNDRLQASVQGMNIDQFKDVLKKYVGNPS